jgi:hypothetical protein
MRYERFGTTYVGRILRKERAHLVALPAVLRNCRSRLLNRGHRRQILDRFGRLFSACAGAVRRGPAWPLVQFRIWLSLSARLTRTAVFNPRAGGDFRAAAVAGVGGLSRLVERIGCHLFRFGLQGQTQPAGATGRGDHLRPSSLFRILPCCGAHRIGSRFYCADLPWNRDPRARSPSFPARLLKPAATALDAGGASSAPILDWSEFFLPR